MRCSETNTMYNHNQVQLKQLCTPSKSATYAPLHFNLTLCQQKTNFTYTNSTATFSHDSPTFAFDYTTT